MGVRLRVLGPLEADVAGRQVSLGGRRPRDVLAALALAAGQPVTVDQLVAAVWGEDLPASAREMVSVHVSGLRKAFARAGCDGEVIETTSGGYRLRTDTVRTDVAAAEDLVARARDLTGSGRKQEAASLLREARALWRGPVLDAPETAALRTGAIRLEELRLTVAEDLADLDVASGHHDRVAGELRALVAEHPLRERMRALLMRALWQAGRQADALAVYAEGRRLLADELGLEPGRELRRLYEAILSDGTEDAGPVAPATRTQVVRPAELPPPPSAFTGRAAELAALTGLLDAGPHLPVAVVSGVGGVGKTSLVLHWAHEVADRFADGQLFVDLRGHDPDTEPLSPGPVLGRLLRALGVSGERVPSAVEERAALYRSTLQGRRVLVLLDNAASTAQVRPLLPGSASCCVVVTARRRLDGLVAAGAVAVPVEVLTGDDVTDLLGRVTGTDAVTAQRPAALRVGALCDGLPLAMRIAASRLAARPAWSFADLADRLADERGRLDQLSHDDLQVRSSVELSYRGLAPPAALAFRRLGLLDAPGGIAPVTLAALLDGPVHEAEALLEELVEEQLLQPLGRDLVGWPRYRFHDLVRLFAGERADAEEPAADRTAAQARVFGCLLGLSDSARRNVYGGDFAGVHTVAPRWHPPGGQVVVAASNPLAVLEVERSNIVAAVAVTARLGWSEMCWSLVARTILMLEAHMYLDDWRAITDRALSVCRAAGDRRGTAAMLYSRGALLLDERRLAEAVAPLTAAAETFEALGDDRSRALALRRLASAHTYQGDLAAGLRGFEHARELAAATGDRLTEAHTLGYEAHIHMLEGRLEHAERLLDRALAINPAQNTRADAQLRKRLAEVYQRQGRGAEAVRTCEELLDTVRGLRDPTGEAFVLLALGEALHEVGERVRARAKLEAALQVAEHVGERLVEGRALLALGRLGGPDAADRVAAATAVFAAIGANDWHARAVAARDGL